LNEKEGASAPAGDSSGNHSLDLECGGASPELGKGGHSIKNIRILWYILLDIYQFNPRKYKCLKQQKSS
jgi:hypothetical protein